MCSVAQFEGPFDNHFLPPFITTQPAQPQEHRAKDGSPRTQGNGFWINVSGFQPDRSYLVYRFFLDIGHTVQSSVTSSSTIRLKYFSATDCEAALSYDNQRIGYGADIHVRVKAEHPAPKLKIGASRDLKTQPEEEPKAEQSSTPVIDIEVASPNAVCPESELQPEPATEPEPELEPEPEPEPKPKQEMEPKNRLRQAPLRKWNVLQWLKHKISYIFYL